MPDLRVLTHGRIETRITKNWRSFSGRAVPVLALSLPLLGLCLLPAGAHAQTSEIVISDLDTTPPPAQGTLSNGVGFVVSDGIPHSTQGYVFYPQGTVQPQVSPQVWTFDQPVSLRFGLRGLNLVNECFLLPVEAEVEFQNPAHSWDPDTRMLCRINSSPVSESIFTIAGPVTELVLEAVNGAAGAGRGPGFFQVILQTDLAIEKIAEVLDANQVRFTLTVSNSGPVDATEVTVVDELPACTTHVSNDCGAAVVGSEVTWTIGNLTNGSTAACEILVDAAACIGEGTQTNTATVEAAQDETNPDNNTATAEFELAASPAVTLDKTGSGPDPLTVGATVDYSFLVTNTGNVTLSNVTVTDPLPGLSPIACSDDTLAPGAEMTCTASYTVTQDDVEAGVIENTATAAGQPPQGPQVTGEDSAMVPPQQTPGITLEKSGTGPDPLAVGDTVEYSFVVTNTGNVTLSSVTVTDPLPGLSPIECPVDTLAPGADMTCTATYTVTQDDADAGFVENTATVTGEPPSGSPVSDEDGAVVPPSQKPGISMQKSGSGPDPLTVGATIDYTFLVTNIGNVTLSDVTVTDPMPGLSPVSCPSGTLAPGAEMTCTATYTVTQADVDAGTVENTATVTGQPPGNLPTTTDESTTTVPPTTDSGISIEKSGSGPDPLTVGATVDYTFLVTNTGNVTLSDITITDRLPGLSPISCPGTTLAPGAEMTCTATYTVTQANVDAGVIVNTATVTGHTPTGGPPSTDESTATVPPAEPVPALPPLAVLLLVTALSALAAAFLRRVRA